MTTDLLIKPLDTTRNALAEAFAAAFEPGGLAQQLGFCGFNDQNVIDVGAGDGRFCKISWNLGAKSLVCVEPLASSIEAGIKQGWIDADEVVCKDVADVPVSYRGRFDLAVVFNLAPHQTTHILSHAGMFIRPGGTLLVTLSEMNRAKEVLDVVSPNFSSSSCSRVWRTSKPQLSNNVMVVASNLLAACV